MPWSSERLIYRHIEDTDDVFLQALSDDIPGSLQQTSTLPTPKGKQFAKDTITALGKEFMHAMICLPPQTPTEPPTPIGFLTLDSDPRRRHHRRADIGIAVHHAHRGRGYGSEALRWTLAWAFRRAGLHRVGIGAFGFNERAIRLYERVGFVREGALRDAIWHDGGFCDIVQLSMLEGEWWERYGKEAKEAEGAAE